jgi:hypothetical protein
MESWDFQTKQEDMLLFVSRFQCTFEVSYFESSRHSEHTYECHNAILPISLYLDMWEFKPHSEKSCQGSLAIFSHTPEERCFEAFQPLRAHIEPPPLVLTHQFVSYAVE